MPWKNLAIFFAITTAFLLGYACRHNKLEDMSLVSTALASPEMIDLIKNKKVEYKCDDNSDLKWILQVLNENRVIPASVSIIKDYSGKFAYCFASLLKEQ